MVFTSDGDAYDRFMGRYSDGLSAPFADFAGVVPGRRVVEVGCGSGALTAELVHRLGPSAVSGAEPSASLLAAARRRAPGADLREAAAEALPFADGEFDLALAQLVVHFMADPVAGLREMARVTRPGGAVAACVWDLGGDRAPLSPFWRAARTIAPDVLDESERAGTRRGHLAELMAVAGLAAIRSAELVVTREHPTFEEWWRPYTLGVGPAGSFVTTLSGDGWERLRRCCHDLLGDGPFTITGVAWTVRGRVPGG